MLRMPYDLQVNDETVATDEPIGPSVVCVRLLQLSCMRRYCGAEARTRDSSLSCHIQRPASMQEWMRRCGESASVHVLV